MSDFEWTLADEEMLQIAEKNFIRPKMDDLDDSEFEWDLEVIQDIEDAAGLPKWNNKSLWELYRMNRRGKNGSLSVSDLIGPVWCEQAWSYKLRSFGHKKPKDRPKALTGKTGKIIPIDRKVNVKREKILVSGTKVHAKLEVAVMGEAVKVKTKTQEENYALKLFNMMVGLDNLLTIGITRELPIFGFINDILIIGIIDEISRKSLDEASTPEVKKTNPPTQSTLDAFLVAPAQQTSTLKSSSLTGFIISDSKTRHSAALPPKKDSKGARLQISIYHQLFSAIFDSPLSLSTTSTSDSTPPSPVSSFDFVRLFEHLSLDPHASFSAEFLEEVGKLAQGMILMDRIEESNSLVDFVGILDRYGELLRKDNGKVLEDRCEIVYRLRPRREEEGGKSKPYGRRRKGLKNTVGETQASTAQSLLGGVMEGKAPLRVEGIKTEVAILEEVELEVNLSSLNLRNPDLEEPISSFDSPFFVSAEAIDSFELPLNSQAFPATPPSRNKRSTPIITQDSPSRAIESKRLRAIPPRPIEPLLPLGKPEKANIIGIDSFFLDLVELKEYLKRAMGLWQGVVEVMGVGREDTSRCRTCEFEEGCEWREMKAAEATKQNQSIKRR